MNVASGAEGQRHIATAHLAGDKWPPFRPADKASCLDRAPCKTQREGSTYSFKIACDCFWMKRERCYVSFNQPRGKSKVRIILQLRRILAVMGACESAHRPSWSIASGGRARRLET